MNKKNGTYSQETLTHFRCGKCDKWWSIGDAKNVEKKEWYCPWCGVRQTMKKNGR
ncbi:MAG: hypothetical protein WD579_03625 [Candidatus Paceibacterota bacterium]